MGKVRRYKKKLSKASAASTNDNGKPEEQSLPVDYLALAEELMNLNKNDDKMSVCSVMKSVKSSGGDESLKLKKDAKRFLKRAFLLKRLEKKQNSIHKKKNKSQKDDDSDDADNVDEVELKMSNQKVLDWPVGNTSDSKHRAPSKKHTKGFQKKQNAQLANDLALFSKKIKKQQKNHIQNTHTA